jgi:uncharacterized protein (DUF2267 family)
MMTKQTFIENVKTLADIHDDTDAERIAMVTLHVLRSQISTVENRDILDMLPADLDKLWINGTFQRFISLMQRLQTFDKQSFLEQVRETADIPSIDRTEQIVKAVFTTLKKAIPEIEVRHLKSELSNGVLDMWDTA